LHDGAVTPWSGFAFSLATLPHAAAAHMRGVELMLKMIVVHEHRRRSGLHLVLPMMTIMVMVHPS
jgi:hypothetical protein